MKNRGVIRKISIIVLMIVMWEFCGLYQLAYALKDTSKIQKRERSDAGAAVKPEQALSELDDLLADMDEEVDSDRREELKKALKQKRETLVDIDRAIREEFSETEKLLKFKGLSSEIIDRHYDFVKSYEGKYKELIENIETIRKSGDRDGERRGIKEAREFLGRHAKPVRHQALDPDKLPHRSAQPINKMPRLTKEEYLAGNRENNEGGVPASSVEQSAGVSDNKSKTKIDPPTESDLSETIEIQFTDAIRAKAEELEKKPHLIYNWVRNHIEFVPTYGSIQGADMCLQTKKCNAMDTSSLLISLLRYSGIHARYVFGTIELPIEKVMNWAGGFTDAVAAIEFLAMGGIPVSLLRDAGGKIVSAQFEHTWVEAYIRYFPFRGAQHITGKGNKWVKMDGSFKEFLYTEPVIDIESAVPFDAEALVNRLLDSATINEEEGYMTGVDTQLLEQSMDDYIAAVEEYLNENDPDAGVEEIAGKKEIIKKEFPYLPGTLPYKVIVTGERSAEIPHGLRHSIAFKLVKDIYEEINEDYMYITKSLPEIAGKKITLSYSPATEADVNLINSFIPEPHADGSPIDISELPDTLPAYLINVIPELRIASEVVSTGNSVNLGENESFTMIFNGPNMAASTTISQLLGGEYFAIALNTGSISGQEVKDLKQKLEQNKEKINNDDLAGLLKDDIIGDLLYATALSYYVELDKINYFQAKQNGIVSTRLPSEAKFFTKLNVKYIFGTPLTASEDGLAIDVARNLIVVSAINGDKEEEIQYLLNSGIHSSALEHSVPEKMFSTTGKIIEGVSAVKSIQIANDEGIPIYFIDSSNIDTLLPKLEVDQNIAVDIQNAINAGKAAIVPKTNINLNNWTGCGYIIIDLDTGNGAYLLSGGLNGGWLLIVTGLLLLTIASLSAVSVLTLATLALIYIGIGICFLSSVDEYELAALTFVVIARLTALTIWFAGVTGGVSLVFGVVLSHTAYVLDSPLCTPEG